MDCTNQLRCLSVKVQSAIVKVSTVVIFDLFTTFDNNVVASGSAQKNNNKLYPFNQKVNDSLFFFFHDKKSIILLNKKNEFDHNFHNNHYRNWTHS